MMEKFGLPKTLVDQVAGMLKTNKKTDVPLSEKIIRDNLEGKKSSSSFVDAYSSIVSEERKKEVERRAKFEQDAVAAHKRMGKSIVEAKEGTTPTTAREKDLAAKKPPKDKITHADVLHARGVKLEDIEKLVAAAVSTANAKRLSVSLEEQKEIVNAFARSFLLSLDKLMAESKLDDATKEAIKHDFHVSLFNSVNVGNAVKKINEASKIIAVMKKYVKDPEQEKPAAKEGLNKMTKTEEVSMDEATLSAKAARAGKDIGKPGKMFSKIASSAAKKYGSEEAGKRVAGSILKKMRNEEIVQEAPVDGVAAGSMEGDKHLCATKVMHKEWKEGRTLFSQHAEPAEDGSIAWYDVMFEHGIEKKVATVDLEILVSESHMSHKKKK